MRLGDTGGGEAGTRGREASDHQRDHLKLYSTNSAQISSVACLSRPRVPASHVPASHVPKIILYKFSANIKCCLFITSPSPRVPRPRVPRTENYTLQIQRKYQVLLVYHVPESPPPRLPASPPPRLPASPPSSCRVKRSGKAVS